MLPISPPSQARAFRAQASPTRALVLGSPSPLRRAGEHRGTSQRPRLSMTLKKWVHKPIILGNDPIVFGSWRLLGTHSPDFPSRESLGRPVE